MTITRLKTKNQVTLPVAVIKRLGLKPNELFAIDVEKNYIKLTPVALEPRYTPEELRAVDRIVEKEKGKARTVKAGKDFSSQIRHLVKS